MHRAKLLLLVLIVYLLAGSAAYAEAKQRNAEETEGNVSQEQIILTEKEKYVLKEWVHAAELAEEAFDFETAIQYYTKVKDYFPDTEEGVNAGKSLETLVKTQKK
ncbi:MAG: hypothetical protein ABII88_01575 [Candidatus Omnitrophota bacterium]